MVSTLVRGIGLAVLTGLLVAGCADDDPRKYPDGEYTFGFRTLDEALHRHGVDLPCQDGLRWFDDEGFVGSGGTLYLKLTPPPQCLTALITGLGGDPAQEQRARDANGAARRPSLPFLPSTVDWKFPPGHDYGEYRLPSRGREDLQLFLDHSTTPVTGYLVAHHR